MKIHAEQRLPFTISLLAGILVGCVSLSGAAENSPREKSSQPSSGVTRTIISTTKPAIPPPPPAIIPSDIIASRRPPEARNVRTLGLPRLDKNAAVPVPPGKFDVDALIVPADALGARKQSQRGIDFMAIDGSGSWSRALRGSPRDVVFVSFCLNASEGSEIEIGGAMIRIEPVKKTEKMEVLAATLNGAGGITWKSVGFRCAIDYYGGQRQSALPTLTVRLDPILGVWNLYAGTLQIADDLPLVDEAKKNARRMNIRAGASGAQLYGAVVSDDNPLFTDENGNGVEDSFEIEKNGALLSARSLESERKEVAKEWRLAQRTRGGTVLSSIRPAADSVASNKAPRK
jgi:hypothetical protein